MKPSGPGLLFVVRVLIAVSISLLVIGLFIFSISSWLSWKTKTEFVHFFEVFHFIGILLLVVLSYDALYFCSVPCNFFFISTFIDLTPLPLFVMSLAKGLSILFIFQRIQLSFIDLFYSFCSLYFIYLCSDLYDFFPSTTSTFVCSPFSSSFRCDVNYLFENFLYSWGKLVSLKYSHFRTAFAASHRFWIVRFPFPFSPGNFLFPL